MASFAAQRPEAPLGTGTVMTGCIRGAVTGEIPRAVATVSQ